MKRILGMAAILFGMLVLLNCGKEASDKQGAKPAMKIATVRPFYYVGLGHTGPYTEHQEVIEQFLSLAESQELTLTGPMMGIYFNSPEQVPQEELEWMIAFEVEDSLEVAPPLELHKWRFERVVKTIHYGAPETIRNTYNRIFEFMQGRNLKAGPVAVERFLYPHKAMKTLDSLQTEVWMTMIP
ncbi:MAG: hypothetical protein Kow0037_31430 [Calditrichia bacterium]